MVFAHRAQAKRVEDHDLALLLADEESAAGIVGRADVGGRMQLPEADGLQIERGKGSVGEAARDRQQTKNAGGEVVHGGKRN